MGLCCTKQCLLCVFRSFPIHYSTAQEQQWEEDRLRSWEEKKSIFPKSYQQCQCQSTRLSKCVFLKDLFRNDSALLKKAGNVNVSIASMDSIPTKHTIFSTWYSVEPTLGDNCILVVEGEGSGALWIATFKEVDRAIFSEMHRRSTEARSEGEKGGVMERDGKKRGKQLVNVADHLCISQGIKSLLSVYCASRLRFFRSRSSCFLKTGTEELCGMQDLQKLN